MKTVKMHDLEICTQSQKLLLLIFVTQPVLRLTCVKTYIQGWEVSF